MAPTDPRLAKMAEIFKLVQDSVSMEQFVAGLNALKKRVDAVGATNEKEFKLMQGALAAISKKIQADHRDDFKAVKKECDKLMAGYDRQMAQVMRIASNLQDGEDGEDGRDGKDGAQGPKGDKGDQGDPGPAGDAGTTVRVGWGAHPLTIQGLGVTVDKNTRIINFVGTAVTSVVRSPQGVVTVTLTGGGGGGGGQIYVETPNGAIDGVNTVYTTTKPIGVVVALDYNGEAIHPNEYTVSGSGFTMGTPLPVVSGAAFTIAYQGTSTIPTGTGINPQVPTGTINGTNKVFVATGVISVINSDGQVLTPTVDYSVSYSSITNQTTITYVLAPQSSVYAF